MVWCVICVCTQHVGVGRERRSCSPHRVWTLVFRLFSDFAIAWRPVPRSAVPPPLLAICRDSAQILERARARGRAMQSLLFIDNDIKYRVSRSYGTLICIQVKYLQPCML